MGPRRLAASFVLLALPVVAQLQAPAQVKFLTVNTGVGPPAASAVGDVNLDGHADVAVRLGGTASAPPGYQGFVAVISGADDSVLFNVPGPKAGGLVGFGLAPAGDLDLDGVPDLIVGIPGSDTANADAGEVRVVSGVDGTTVQVLSGGLAGDALGRFVAGIADADGDGVPDVAASSAAPPRVKLWSGASGALLHSWQPQIGDGFFPVDLSSAGDVDGDGRGDVAFAGGGPENLGGPVRVVSGANGNALLLVPNIYATSPGSIGPAGDVDGDGHDDLAVPGKLGGHGHVVSGASGGELLHFESTSSSYSTHSVRLVGDSSGDGVADFVISERNEHPEIPGRVSLRSGIDGTTIFGVGPNTGVKAWGNGYGNPLWGPPAFGVGDIDEDGIADFAATGFGTLSIFSGAPANFFVDIAGDIWLTAYDLLGEGALTPGSQVTLRILHFLPSAPVLLVVGLTALKLPAGGATMIPSMDLVLGPFITDGDGTVLLIDTWPAALGPGSELWVQAWSPPLVYPWWMVSNGLVARP